MKKILVNKVRGDVIENETRHDFKWCKCKSVAVDGGHDYLKRVGVPGSWEDLSEVSE